MEYLKDKQKYDTLKEGVKDLRASVEESKASFK